MLIRSNANSNIAAEGEGRTVSGLAIPFSSPSELIQEYGKTFYESIAPGAFDESIKTRDVYAFLLHDSKQPLASTRSKTLTLDNSNDGLRFSFSLPDTSYANDALALIRSGVLRGMSFGFAPGKTRQTTLNGKPHLIREKATLKEISIVYAPAYEKTSVNLRDKGLANESVENIMYRFRLLGAKV